MIYIRTLLVILAGLVCWTAPVQAEPTNITVRAISKGGKFIGTSMGGVGITIRDAQSGELLAQGVTRGSTGSTTKIMNTAHKRGEPLSTPDAAAFTTTLDIDQPRLVEISAYGPLAQRQAAARASVTHWLVPGQSIAGDGLVLEIPGLVVDVLAPPTHSFFDEPPGKVEIHANITLMCGCPITPGGLWDANDLRVAAMVKRNGQPIGTTTLTYAGKPSQFTGKVAATRPGAYEVVVYAHDQKIGNTGLDAATFVVRE